MADYIKREDAIDYIEGFVLMNKYYHPYSKRTTIPIAEAIARINETPSADVQPVVRCKDCKYHATGADYTDDFGEPLDKAMMCLGIRYGGVDPDWFCEHGERIGGNNE